MERADPNTLWPTGPTARFLEVSPARVGQLVKAGVLRPAMETPLGRLFDPADVKKLRDERQAVSA